MRRSRFVEEIEDLEVEGEMPIVETWLLEDAYEDEEGEILPITTNEDAEQIEQGES